MPAGEILKFKCCRTESVKNWYSGIQPVIVMNRWFIEEEGNFCDDSKQAVEPQVMAWYNQCMGYVDISDHMEKQLFDVSTYLQVDHEIVFPPSGSNSTQQLDTVIFIWG